MPVLVLMGSCERASGGASQMRFWSGSIQSDAEYGGRYLPHLDAGALFCILLLESLAHNPLINPKRNLAPSLGR